MCNRYAVRLASLEVGKHRSLSKNFECHPPFLPTSQEVFSSPLDRVSFLVSECIYLNA